MLPISHAYNSAVCHGPAAIADVKLSNGNYLIAGHNVTGFSNAEEDAVGLSKYMPFMLEDSLNKNSGGKYVKADQDWGEKVVVENGGKLITGQNPSSGEFEIYYISQCNFCSGSSIR